MVLPPPHPGGHYLPGSSLLRSHTLVPQLPAYAAGSPVANASVYATSFDGDATSCGNQALPRANANTCARSPVVHGIIRKPHV